MRNLTLIVSLDWVPPHKESQNESIGILAGTVANFRNEYRSDADMIWPLAVIAGPDEPTDCETILRDTFNQLNKLATEGN